MKFRLEFNIKNHHCPAEVHKLKKKQQFFRSDYLHRSAGLSLGGDLGEKVSQFWLTSPYFELREKFKRIEHIGKSKFWTKTSPRNPENVAKSLPV